MYRERGYCKRCGTPIYREEWRRPKLPVISIADMIKEPDSSLTPPYEIEYFYKYFDEQGNEVVRCPKCRSIWI